MRTVRLSAQQEHYLAGADYLAHGLREHVAAHGSGGSGGALLLADDVAEMFRSAFTERLAEVGFDQSYSLNGEGQMLETLIDRFDD